MIKIDIGTELKNESLFERYFINNYHLTLDTLNDIPMVTLLIWRNADLKDIAKQNFNMMRSKNGRTHN